MFIHLFFLDFFYYYYITSPLFQDYFKICAETLKKKCKYCQFLIKVLTQLWLTQPYTTWDHTSVWLMCRGVHQQVGELMWLWGGGLGDAGRSC